MIRHGLRWVRFQEEGVDSEIVPPIIGERPLVWGPTIGRLPVTRAT
jgi:hypothetical protein